MQKLGKPKPPLHARASQIDATSNACTDTIESNSHYKDLHLTKVSRISMKGLEAAITFNFCSRHNNHSCRVNIVMANTNDRGKPAVSHK